MSKQNERAGRREKRKILFRLRSMETGGVQKVMLNLMNTLDKEKFKLYLLLDLNQGELLKDLPGDVGVYYLGEGKDKLSLHPLKRFVQLAYRRLILKLYLLFPFLLKKKLGFTPDVEIAFMNPSLPGLMRSPFLHSKKLNWFHSDIRVFKRKAAERIARMMNRCDVTVFVSYATMQNMITHVNTRIDNSIYIYNAIDYRSILERADDRYLESDALLSSGDGVKAFVSVGRLVYQKGYDMLLEAHIEVLKQGFRHRIMIIGDGYQYDELSKRIIEAKVEDSFILLGRKENPYPYISGGDFYIQPSRYEGYPLAIGEALVLNRPVLCTDCGGIREMITSGENGLIVNSSQAELIKGMSIFLTQPELTERIKRRQGFMSFELHNLKVAQNIEELLLQ